MDPLTRTFFGQRPLFPELEPKVTVEEEEAFTELSKAQKDYIKAIGTDPLSVQVGGDHYKTLKIQPMEYSMANKLDACQHTIIKYVTRFREKGGRADLEKAKHTIDLLIKLENL